MRTRKWQALAKPDENEGQQLHLHRLSGMAEQSSAAPGEGKQGHSTPYWILKGARPKQWLKNVLVFAAPGAAGVMLHPHMLLLSLFAFAVFSVTASGLYFINDTLDLEADKVHPVKRFRPVASGAIPKPMAIGIGTTSICIGVLAAFLGSGLKFGAVMTIYVAITLVYSGWLKDEPILDLVFVASGFVLRAIAGAVVTNVVLSNWFLIVASFGSLFMVAGKRHSEHIRLGDDRGSHRVTLAHYTPGFLRFIWALTASVCVTAYCLWAFEKAAASSGPIFFELSIVPFGVAILRYALLLESGHGGAPEEVVLSDKRLQAFGLAWLLLFALGIYGA